MRSSAGLTLAVAVAEPGLETALQGTLEESGHAVERYLAAGDLVDRLRAGRVDAALVASGLYQLTPTRWQALVGAGVPLVLRADAAEADRWPGHTILVARDAGLEQLRQALLTAAAGAPPVSARPTPPSPSPSVAAAPAFAPLPLVPGAARVLAFGGPAGTGRSTIAANVALALGLCAPTILVDADLGCSCAGPLLDADVARNLATLAHADPRAPAEWDRALARDGQPLHPSCPHGVLLCGLPRPEQRASLGPGFFDRLLQEVRRRFTYVVLDTGSDVLSPDTAIHRAALLAADDVLLVARADPLGLWQARSALGVWERQLRLPTARVALVLNQHDPGRHPRPAQISWALRAPIAAVLPEDRTAAERALTQRRPLLFDRHGRLPGALLGLADRVHGGHILLPEEPDRPRGRLARLRARLTGRADIEKGA